MKNITVGDLSFAVQDEGEGPAGLLLHGFPDSHALWRNQVPALLDAGYRVVAPDLRGFGDSAKPSEVDAYGILSIAGDVVGILDSLGIDRAHVVGHDWGGAIGAVLAALSPERVASLTCLSVGHPAAFAAAGWEQREKSWYMLLFQFPGIAERWLAADDFANLRNWSRHPDIDSVIAHLRDPEALTASLAVYRAILPPESLIRPSTALPRIQAPTMGIWSSEDLAITEKALTGTAAFIDAPWRYERINGIGHWAQLDAPGQVNALLLDFLTSLPAPAAAYS